MYKYELIHFWSTQKLQKFWLQDIPLFRSHLLTLQTNLRYQRMPQRCIEALSEHTYRWSMISVTRLGDIWNFLVTNYITKVTRLFSDFMGSLNWWGYFLDNFCKNLGYFLFQHLVTLHCLWFPRKSSFISFEFSQKAREKGFFKKICTIDRRTIWKDKNSLFTFCSRFWNKSLSFVVQNSIFESCTLAAPADA